MSSAFEQGRKGVHEQKQAATDALNLAQSRVDEWHPRFLEIMAPLSEREYTIEYGSYRKIYNGFVLSYEVLLPTRLAPQGRYKKQNEKPDLEVTFQPEHVEGQRFRILGPNFQSLSSSLRLRDYCVDNFGIGPSRNNFMGDLTEDQFLRALGFWHELNVEYADEEY